MNMTMTGAAGRAVLAGCVALGLLAGCAAPGFGARHEVYGVGTDDMLKLRGGPGTGFDTYVGLPNGSVVRVGDCTQTGGTRWCEVSLDRAPGLTGWASAAYLRKL